MTDQESNIIYASVCAACSGDQPLDLQGLAVDHQAVHAQRATVGHVNVPAAVATYALVSGVAASRWGLWTFDLAVSQMLQERVNDQQLGALP